MRVTELTFHRVGPKRPHPESIDLKIELAEGDNIQEAVRRARITARIALGEVTQQDAREMIDAANVMNKAAADLLGDANSLLDGGF